MTRAKGPSTIATTHSSRGQHPRMFSSSSSSSSISSSSCSLSPGPPQQKSSTTTTTTVTTARKRSSWMLSHHEKPGWEDTAATPFEGQQQQRHYHHQHQLQEQSPKHHHQQHRHQRTGSCDQTVVGAPLTSPNSPPSSPLPLGLHKQNTVPTNITPTAAGADMDLEDDHHRRYKQLINGRAQGRSSVTGEGGYSSGHSTSISSARKAMQFETTSPSPPQRPRRKEGGTSTGSSNTRTTTALTAGNEIAARPRFSVSTVVNPRPQVYAVGTATREGPKEVAIKPTTSVRSSRGAKDSSMTPRATKSTAATTTSSAQPTTKSVSTTRISKTRSPTTITTTTTTTTRRVASTIITMGPHLDREHRKLAASASASAAVVVANAGAHSTKTSSNRKERTARASNLSPSGRALGKEGRQAGMELSTELAGTMTTSASSGDNKNTTECTEDTPISAPEPATTPLLPALQMEDEEESPAGIEYSRPAMDTTPTLTGAKLDTGPESTSAFSPPSSPLSSPPLPPATESLPILGSSIIVASHPQTPPRPQTTTPHEMPSDIVHQAPDTPPVTACSPPKETTPIFSLVQQENTDESRPRPLTGTVLATPMVRLQLSPRAESRKTEAKTKTATSAAYTPPAFLSGTPRVFRAFRETSSSRTLSVPQCEIKAAGGEQGRPSEFPTTTVPTTVLSNRSLRVIPTAAEESLEAPYTLATDSIKETPKTLQRPQQPFRKNIWNGRMDSRFNKPQCIVTTTATTTTTTATPQPEKEAIPIAQKNAPTRTGLLAALGTNVARAPLTKVKEPAVMLDLMSLMKERRASPSPSDAAPVERNSGNQFRDRNRPMWSGRSRATNGFRNDNDNDSTTSTTTTTTSTSTFTTNTTNNIYNTIKTSSSGRKITFEDKKAFLKTQEMRRRSLQRKSQSLTNLAVSTSPSPFLHSYPSTSSLPSPTATIDSLSVDTRPDFPWKKDRVTPQQSRVPTPSIPAMSIAIPLKVATVLQGMGYPINNTNTATSPVCYSPSPSPSPTWSTPSTPRIIPSSLSSSSLSSLSSTSTISLSSSYSSVSSGSSVSTSSKTLPLSFPDRLFQARSPSHSSAGSSSVAMMPPPRSFSPRPVRATSVTGAGTPFASTSERYPYYPSSSTMLPSLPSPVLSLTVPERQQQQQQQQQRQRVSSRPVDMDGYFRPRQFSGSRSEDEQSDTSSSTTTTTTTTSSRCHQHFLRPFEKAFVPPQRAGTQQSPWQSSSGSMTKSSSMPQLFPPQPPPLPPPSTTDQDLETPLDTTRYERVRHERSNSTSSIDRQHQQQQQYDQITPEQEEQLMQSCSNNAPATQDISFLTKRLANLQLMDSLCPVPVLVSEPVVQHLQSQPQQQQGQEMMLDATWAMQIQLLLTHLAEQTDLEQESRPRPLPPPPRPFSLLLVPDDGDNNIDKGARTAEGVGLYKQVLTDWLLRLDQLSISSSSSPSCSEMSLYQNHPGLKREVEKIRWQQNVPSNSKTIRSK